jgi:predicted short-subunit dehydrogenase-like oxidoreductase (DUF2520 family)
MGNRLAFKTSEPVSRLIFCVIANEVNLSADPINIAIIGAGAVGKALAEALCRAGYAVSTILDRTPRTARKLAQALGASRSGSEISLIGTESTLVIVAVPDDEIAKVDKSLAKQLSTLNLAGVAHTSGALPGSELEQLSAAGVPVGSWHPLQSFPHKGPPPSLKGVYMAVEGDATLKPILTELTLKLGGVPVDLPAEGKTLYHAAAVFASNFIPV